MNKIQNILCVYLVFINFLYIFAPVKKFLLLILLSSVSFIFATAQSVQQCIVMQYNGQQDKTPLGGVSVTAAGAGSVMSGDDGRFSLNFRTLRAGDQIRFRRIDLAGYEVMNTEALDAMRVGEGTLTIILCQSEELNRLRDGYHSAAAQRYQKQLQEAQQQVEALKQEGKLRDEEFARRMDELEETFEQQMQTLDTYVDKFARIDLSELDAYEQKIIALVQEGKFDEAIALYDDQHLTERLQQGVREQRQLQNDQSVISKALDAKQQEAERLEHNLDEQISLLRKVGGEENIRKADSLQNVKDNKPL